MSDVVGIPNDEYEARRTAFDLARWIDDKFREMEAGGHFSRQYFERVGHNVKRLVEEALPVSRLGLYLATPGADVHATCFADNRPYDALVEVGGVSRPHAFRVEVTTTETGDASTLRRQALARDGHVALYGPVRRSGRTIVAEPEMVDAAEEEERLICVALERLHEKAASGRYGSDTAVLVYLTDAWFIDLTFRAELARRTEAYLLADRPPIAAVYYCYAANLSVDHVRRPSR